MQSFEDNTSFQTLRLRGRVLDSTDFACDTGFYELFTEFPSSMSREECEKQEDLR